MSYSTHNSNHFRLLPISYKFMHTGPGPTKISDEQHKQTNRDTVKGEGQEEV